MADTVGTSIRFRPSVLQRAEALVPILPRLEDMVGLLGRGTRSDVIRMAIEMGLDAMEAEARALEDGQEQELQEQGLQLEEAEAA